MNIFSFRQLRRVVLFLASAVIAGAAPFITVSDATGREAAPVDLGADTFIEFPVALT